MRKERTSYEAIKEAYKKSGLTYAKLAALVGVPVNTLTCWLVGRRQPPDYVAAMLLEKINSHINGEAEYINKDLYRDEFAETVYDICQNTAPKKQASEIMQAFDTLPTVNKK